MLKNKIAVVTGAGAGIGEATARIFARENIEGIAIVDYNYEAACKVAESLGDKAIAVKCDISKWEDVEAAYNQIIERFGRVDILVNNAGITRDGMFHKMSIDQWNMVINTNRQAVQFTIFSSKAITSISSSSIWPFSSARASSSSRKSLFTLVFSRFTSSGLHRPSQRRGVIPLVLFWKRSG